MESIENTECRHLTSLQKPRQSLGFLITIAYCLTQAFSFTCHAVKTTVKINLVLNSNKAGKANDIDMVRIWSGYVKEQRKDLDKVAYAGEKKRNEEMEMVTMQTKTCK